MTAIRCQPKPFIRYSGETLEALRERPPVDPLEWVTGNVLFPAVSASVQSLYDVDTYPWCKGVFDAVRDPDITHITLVWATQVGKTSLEIAVLAETAANHPTPCLVACPDEKVARDMSRNRIQPVLAASPETERLLPPEHARKDLEIDLRWMKVWLGWSGSPAMLGARTIGLLLKMELDKWSTRATSEGDPAELAEERVKDMVEYKIIQDSTPTEEGSSRIWGEWLASDQRTYRVPCPQCRVYQELRWENVELPKTEDGRLAAPERCLRETVYVCPHCSRRITDRDKSQMVRLGVWARRGEKVERDPCTLETRNSKLETQDCVIVVEDEAEIRRGAHAGFHLSSLYSPKLTWGRIGEAWSRACTKGLGAIRNFVNGWLARPFTPTARVTGEDEVLLHRGIHRGEGYAKDTCPRRPIAVLLLVDVQEDCLWYSSWAIAVGKRFYLLRHGQLPADLRSCLPLRAVTFIDGDGRPFRHTHALIDSGHRTSEVYQLCRDQPFTATKGFELTGRDQPVSLKTLPSGVTLMRIGVLTYKDALMDLIKGDNLTDPGCWRLFETCGRDYARQITAERRVIETDRWGRKKARWKRQRDDNHYWDLGVTALAAADALEIQGLDFFREGGGGRARMAGRRRKYGTQTQSDGTRNSELGTRNSR